MKELLRRIRAAWAYGKEVPYITEADENWSLDDSKHLRAFLESGTGRRLSARIRNLGIRAAISAISTDHSERTNGLAAGILQTASFIDSHLAIDVEEEEEQAEIVHLT